MGTGRPCPPRNTIHPERDGDARTDSKESRPWRCGSVTLHVSANAKRLLLEFETVPEGLDKTGLNSFIDALKKIRERMDR